MKDKELDELEKKQEKEFKQFLLLIIAPIVSNLNGFTSYGVVRREYEAQVDYFMRRYKNELFNLLSDIAKSNTKYGDYTITLNKIYNQKWKIKGTNKYINFESVINRHGEKIKIDIAQQIARFSGYELPSRKVLNQITKEVFVKNSAGLKKLVSNEAHKTSVLSTINSEINNPNKEIGKKVFIYNTQADDRVRPSHMSMHGVELTASEAQDAYNGLMSEINCRCYLSPI